MNERSQTWRKKKNELKLQEDQVKEELENVSNNLENKVKTILKISLITGGVFLAGYGLYKILSSRDEAAEPPIENRVEQKPPEVKVKSPGFSLKSMLLERLAIVAVNFIGTQLTMMLTRKPGDAGDKD